MKALQTKHAPQAIGPYSQAMIVGDMLYTSGQIPLTPEGNMVEGDIKAQTEQVFKNLDAILTDAGAAASDVVKATVFIKDMNEFATINEIYAAYFKEHKPARSTVEVARLPKDAKIEIELIAKIPQK